MTVNSGRAVFLTEYPDGLPKPGSFVVREVDIPHLKESEVLLRTKWMSVDPYMRGRMNPNVKSYVPPFTLDAPLDGGAVSEVVESRAIEFNPGDHVVSMQGGWKEYSIAKPRALTKVEPDQAPLSSYLGVLGMPGMTAWAGLTQILEPKGGETLFVSGAGGAVGSLVCQLGKQMGLRVIGSAGSAQKCSWLKQTIGCDIAINYKDYPSASELSNALAEAAPDGIHCYFENVGGDHLQAALQNIAIGGRIALCGLIAQYNAQEPVTGPTNLANLITRSVKVQGFIVAQYAHLRKQFLGSVAPLLESGDISAREEIYEGLDQAGAAFLGLFSGENTGKALVRMAG
ncbi:MAG: NADP-dependent oxidoreductase [Pseudomonadota bacterium]